MPYDKSKMPNIWQANMIDKLIYERMHVPLKARYSGERHQTAIGNMVAVAGRMMGEIEFQLEQTRGMSPLMMEARCDYLSTLHRLGSGTLPRCKYCIRVENRRVPIYRPATLEDLLR